MYMYIYITRIIIIFSFFKYNQVSMKRKIRAEWNEFLE